MALDIGRTTFERAVRRARVEGRGEPRVVIVGGGLSGLATAIQLVRSGVRNFTIIEQSDGVGGTWRDNKFHSLNVIDIITHKSYFREWQTTHFRKFTNRFRLVLTPFVNMFNTHFCGISRENGGVLA